MALLNFGNQEDYGDQRRSDTHKNRPGFPGLKGLLEEAGFREVRRGAAGTYDAPRKADSKLVVAARGGAGG